MYSIANNVYLGIFWIIHTIPEIESVPKLYPKLYIFGNFDLEWSVILIEWRLKNDIFDPKITIFLTQYFMSHYMVFCHMKGHEKLCQKVASEAVNIFVCGQIKRLERCDVIHWCGQLRGGVKLRRDYKDPTMIMSSSFCGKCLNSRIWPVLK